MDTLVIAFLIYIAGVVSRTVYGYLAKVAETGKWTFDTKYLATFIMSLIASLAAGAMTFMGLATEIPADASLLLIFAIAFPSGYTINDGVNRAVNVATTKGGD